jgi:hypothetical protein
MANIGTQQPSQFFTQSADNWYRKEVDVVQLALENGKDIDWFYFDPSPTVQEYRRLSSPLVSTKIGPQMQGGWSQVGQGKRWALVWVDSATGKKEWSMIQVERPAGYQVTTCSCNTSVNPTIRQG